VREKERGGEKGVLKKIEGMLQGIKETMISDSSRNLEAQSKEAKKRYFATKGGRNLWGEKRVKALKESIGS